LPDRSSCCWRPHLLAQWRPLEIVAGDLLRKHHATVSVAESATGGHVGGTALQRARKLGLFAGGFITYKQRHEDRATGRLPGDTGRSRGRQQRNGGSLASGARRRTASTYALSVTGVAGPDGGNDAAPVGTMYVGIADAAGTLAVRRQFLETGSV